MKALKFLMVGLLAVTAVFTAKADDDKPISIGELPAKSRQFIETHFKGVEVSYAKVERDFFDKSYEVRFVNGAKVEFDKSGEWDNVDCHKEKVPAGIVPQAITDYVSKNNPGQIIVKIDRDKRDYEIELKNGLEIKFDLKFNVIGFDD